MFISFNKASESHVYMYGFEQAMPINNVKEYDLNYAILAL